MKFDANRALQQVAYAKELLSYTDRIINSDPDVEERFFELVDLMESQSTERLRSAPILQEHKNEIQSLGVEQGVIVFAIIRAFEQLMPEINSLTFNEAHEVAQTHLSTYSVAELQEDNDSLFLTRAYLTGINYLIQKYT